MIPKNQALGPDVIVGEVMVTGHLKTGMHGSTTSATKCEVARNSCINAPNFQSYEFYTHIFPLARRPIDFLLTVIIMLIRSDLLVEHSLFFTITYKKTFQFLPSISI